jgi:hypothetical protein
MLQIIIPSGELYDEERNEFILVKGQTIQLEHSLISMSKWESKWKKAFLSKEEKTLDESIDYIKFMVIRQDVDPNIYKFINNDILEKVSLYIEDSMTATTFSKDSNDKISRKIITSEVIYYWMVTLQIPFECEKWHLNRLLTLIKICNIENQPKKKFNKRALLKNNYALNAARRAELNTSG